MTNASEGRRPHISQMNGRSRGALSTGLRGDREQLRFALNRMNGARFFAYSVWPAPEGANLVEAVPLSDEYIQAGGSAQAMTVEARVVAPDGSEHQFVVGKPGVDPEGEPSQVIWMDDRRVSVHVFANKVFTADEAADVFVAYYATAAVPEGYTLREVAL